MQHVLPASSRLLSHLFVLAKVARNGACGILQHVRFKHGRAYSSCRANLWLPNQRITMHQQTSRTLVPSVPCEMQPEPLWQLSCEGPVSPKIRFSIKFSLCFFEPFEVLGVVFAHEAVWAVWLCVQGPQARVHNELDAALTPELWLRATRQNPFFAPASWYSAGFKNQALGLSYT